MAYDTIEELLTLHEGVRRYPYKDTVGKLTIGIGFNLDDVGLLRNEMDFILRNRIKLVEEDLERFYPWYHELDPVRQAVLIDMCYNMGITTLRKFKRTLGSIERGEYELASQQMLESLWARQVGQRAIRLSTMMRTGEWPEL